MNLYVILNVLSIVATVATVALVAWVARRRRLPVAKPFNRHTYAVSMLRAYIEAPSGSKQQTIESFLALHPNGVLEVNAAIRKFGRSRGLMLEAALAELVREAFPRGVPPSAIETFGAPDVPMESIVGSFISVMGANGWMLLGQG